MVDDITKNAQSRSLLQQVRPSNITRQIPKLDPVYREQYNRLVEADKFIRDFNQAATDENGFTMKELLKDLRRNNKQKRWVAVLDRAARINSIAKNIWNNSYVEDLREGQKGAAKEFYFDKEDAGSFLGGRQPVDLEAIKSITEPAAKSASLNKEALLGGLVRKMTDKLLFDSDGDIREAKLAIRNIFSKAETLATRILSAYKALDAHRAKGNVGAYLKALNDIQNEQKKFEGLFKASYPKVQPFIDEDKLEAEEETAAPSEDAEKPTGEAGGPDEGSEETDGGGEADQPSDVLRNRPDEPVAARRMEPPAEDGEEVMTVTEDELEPANEPSEPYPGNWQGVLFDESGRPVSQDYSMEAQPQEEPTQGGGWKDVRVTEQGEVVASDYAEAAKVAIKKGNNGLAAAILSKYSQYLEDEGNLAGSAKMLALAQELINEN